MRKFVLIFFFLVSFSGFSEQKKKLVAYDTSKISSGKKVSPEKEKEIFSDKDFIYKKEVKAAKGWWEAFLEWLAGLFGKSVEKSPQVSFKILKYILVAIFIIGILFVLWKSKFRGLLKGSQKKIADPLFADLPENIEGIHIETLIDEAVGLGNYRMAVRWCFLKSLQWLNRQNKITWRPSKTNVDYQQELKDKDLKEDFVSLSRVFEYVWYGEINPTEKLCMDYRIKVNNFVKNADV